MSKGYQDLPISQTTEDKLGATPYVESLAEFILDCKTPMTIAIQGDWGAGKTSIMELVRAKISDEVLSFYFNTWQYSQFQMHDFLPISLLHNFLESVQGGKSAKDKITALAKGMPGVVWGLAKNLAVEKILGEVNATKLSESTSEIKTAETIYGLKESLVNAVKDQLLKLNKKRMVVFIDDLDRLPPDKAVEMLEVMKLFMDIDQCVFVLAIDYAVVVQGINKKYSGYVDEQKGRSFFDKIIQLPFSVPVGQYNIDEYLQELLSRTSSRTNPLLAEKDIVKRLIEATVGRNPRAIKRVLNAFLLLDRVAEKKGVYDDENYKNSKTRIIFAIICLQTSYDKVYDLLCTNIDDISIDFFEELLDEENYSTADKPFFVSLRELSLNNLHIPRLVSFFEVFKDCIQLDASPKVSNIEIDNLKNLLSFSTITSVTDEKQYGQVSMFGKFRTVEDFIATLQSKVMSDSFIAIYNQILSHTQKLQYNISITYAASYVTFKNLDAGKNLNKFLSIYPASAGLEVWLCRKSRREKIESERLSEVEGDYWYGLLIPFGEKLTDEELRLLETSYLLRKEWKNNI